MKNDDQLQREVTEELAWHSFINADQINVTVKDGHVTLSGDVFQFEDKWHAEQAAGRVGQVRSVIDLLEVKLAVFNQRNDKAIEKAARTALEWKPYLRNHAVKVAVDDGWLVLTGELEYEYQKQSAAYAVRSLMGIKGISNDIALRPMASVVGIEARIEASLKRRAVQDARDITVSVEGASVTLTGTVATLSERALAQSSASDTAGVVCVINHIAVLPVAV